MPYRTAREWELRGVEVRRLRDHLSAHDRQEGWGWPDSESWGEVTTWRLPLMKRLENAGAVPEVVNTFLDTSAELRLYRVPRQWIRQPLRRGTSGQTRHPLKPPAWWEAQGVNVVAVAGRFERGDRESGVFVDPVGDSAAVVTTRPRWQRYIEGQGIRPDKIVRPDRGTVTERRYTIPRSWARLPLPRPGRASPQNIPPGRHLALEFQENSEVPPSSEGRHGGRASREFQVRISDT